MEVTRPDTSPVLAEEGKENNSNSKADEKTGSTIFVGNLTKEVTEELLTALFKDFGVVKSCKLIKVSYPSEPYGFVEFEERGQAEKALAAMGGRILLGNQIRVNWAHPQGYLSPSKTSGTWNDQYSGRNGYSVFVGDIGPDMNEEELKDHFAKFGIINGCRVVRDAVTSKSKNYGFVTFDAYKAAEAAIREMHGTWIEKRTITVNWAQRKPSYFQERKRYQYTRSYDQEFTASQPDTPSDFNAVSNLTGPNNSTIFVGRLQGLSEEGLIRMFNMYGPILTVKPFPEKSFGFVTFTNKSSAVRAIMDRDQTFIGANQIKVAWSKERIPQPGQLQPQSQQQYPSTSAGDAGYSSSYPDSVNYIQHQFSQSQTQIQAQQQAQYQYSQPAMSYWYPPNSLTQQTYPLFQNYQQAAAGLNLNYIPLPYMGYGIPSSTDASQLPSVSSPTPTVGGSSVGCAPPAYKKRRNTPR